MHKNTSIQVHFINTSVHISIIVSHLRMTDPRRFLAVVSELTDAQCTASDGGHRAIYGVLSSMASYFAT